MFNRQIASALALGLFGSCLFAQGLQTKATKDDWEEINFEFNSAILSDGYPTLLRLAELLQQHRDYKIKVEGNTDYVGSVATWRTTRPEKTDHSARSSWGLELRKQ